MSHQRLYNGPELIRIGSKIFNPRFIVLCEPVKISVFDNPGDEDSYRQLEALEIHLAGQHSLIISPEEWQGVKALLEIIVAEPQPLPEKPQD